MFVPFEHISPHARVWIYQAGRALTPAELDLIERTLQQFTAGWSAHGQPLKTSFTIRYNQFIVLAADEDHQSPSGCSIDSSVRVLKELQQATGVEMLDRSRVGFKTGAGVLTIPVHELKQKFQEGVWDGATIMFNNLVATRAELENRWMVPAGETWLKRYIAREVV